MPWEKDFHRVPGYFYATVKDHSVSLTESDIVYGVDDSAGRGHP